MKTVDELLGKLNNFKKAKLFYYEHKFVTTEQFLNLKNQSVDKLNEIGIKPHSVVMVKGDITPQTIALLLACLKLNLIVVPCNVNDAETIDTKIDIANVEFIIEAEFKTNSELHFKIDRKQPRQKVITLFSTLKNNSVPGLILFTSGTSGQPKAAVHNVNLLFKKFIANGKTLKTVGFLLYDHWGGLNTILYSLFNGGCIICLSKREPEYVCQLIEETGAELLPVSPSFINLLLASKALKKHDTSSLKIVTFGSEPMPQYTLNELEKVLPNIKLKQTYGLIEIGVLQTRSKNKNSLFFELDNKEINYRVRNNILEIKTESAMLGYLNAEQPFTDDGWFITGDEVEVLGKELRIIGRKSDIINVGGEKVYPLEVEAVLLTHEKVIDALVYGQQNFLLGSVVCAKIYTSADKDTKILKNEIIRFCRKLLKPYQVPIRLELSTEPLHGDRLKKVRKV